jgi:hypothetical protein
MVILHPCISHINSFIAWLSVGEISNLFCVCSTSLGKELKIQLECRNFIIIVFVILFDHTYIQDLI